MVSCTEPGDDELICFKCIVDVCNSSVQYALACMKSYISNSRNCLSVNVRARKRQEIFMLANDY